MSDLVIPFLPSNLVVPAHMKNAVVDGDLYHMCERVKEIDPSLFIVMLDENRHPWKYAICEHCRDGVDRTVFDVRELDARVLNELRRIMQMPLNYRLKELEKTEHLWEQEELDREAETLYEEFGRQMWSQLEHDGFIQRGVSYPKAGVATRGRVRR